MVKSGHMTTPARDIRPVEFSSSLDRGNRLEVIELAEMHRRRLRFNPDNVPERLLFEMIIIVRSGTGTHSIDFRPVDLRPHSLVRIHPGQVHRWGVADDLIGDVVLASSEETQSYPIDSPPSCDLDPELVHAANATVDSLRAVQDRPESGELSTSLWRALMHLFDHAAAPGTRELPPAYIGFRRAIDADPARSRHVRDYIADLGWSERTVRRACLDATGETPKQILDERVALQAKRLLAYTDRSAASIGAELGFLEATNFHKFFVRRVGQTPAAFRTTVRLPR